MPKRLTFPLIALFLCTIVHADVLTLKDGTKLEGDVKRDGDSYTVRLADGTAKTIGASQVQSIQLGNAGPKAGAGGGELLASLRRAVENINDPKQVVDRFQKFIDQNKNTPAAEEARKDLAVWQERVDKNMTRIGGKWVTAEEKADMIAKAGDTVKEAFDLVKQNRYSEAQPILEHAVELDPHNAAAQYLLGVTMFRQDKLAPARKAFEGANAAAPNNGAVLNDLAVVLWRQNAFPAALNFLDQAMTSMPANKEILDNVAEALNYKKEDPKRSRVAANVTRKFAEQDAQLEGVMSQYGWYRWGGTWVDQMQLDRMRAAEQENKNKMDQLQRDFDNTQNKITQNEQRIIDDQRMMNDMQQQSYYQDPNTGRMFHGQLPDSYYQLQNEMSSLQTEQRSLQTQLTQMRASAQRMKSQMPQPKYTGVLQLIGVEGTPGMSEAAPATQPSGAPAGGNPTPPPANAGPPSVGGPIHPAPAPATRPGYGY